MSASRKLGLLYIFRGDTGVLAEPGILLSSVAAPIRDMLGEEVFWFGWNDWRICLPARANMSELAQDSGPLADLSYLRIFSEAAELTWQRDSGGRPLARLCTEVEAGSKLAPQLDSWIMAHDGIFECRRSRRILMGVPQSDEEVKTGALFEVRYPRPFIYPGIECDRGKRVEASVCEYLDRMTQRLCLTRYCSIHASEAR